MPGLAVRAQDAVEAGFAAKIAPFVSQPRHDLRRLSPPT